MFPSIRIFMIATLLLVSVAAGFVAADDGGSKIFSEACSPCHSAGTRPLDKVHLSRDQRKDTVDRMIDLGAEVSKKKIPELLDYLVRSHGPTGTGTSEGEKAISPKNPGN